MIDALLLKRDVLGAVNNEWFQKIIGDLYTIIAHNFNNVGEFQSIFQLHELCICLLVEYLQHNNVDIKTANFAGVDECKTPFDQESLKTPAATLLQDLWGSFTAFESFGLNQDPIDKSVNAHNCRKFCMLSKMFILHKTETSLDELQGLILKYAKAYIEIPPVVTDLQMYCLHLDQAKRATFLEELKKSIDEKD